MLIDWFTVVAQILNFLVLVWLLKRFLYQPIQRAIDQRERQIAERFAQAERKDAQAQREQTEFRQKNQDFDQMRAALIEQMEKEAKSRREQLLNEIRADSQALRNKLEEDLRNQQKNLETQIIDKIHREVFAIARRTLEDLAGATLEDRIVAVFIERLRNLGQEKIDLMRVQDHVSIQEVLVRTGFEPSIAQKEQVAEALRATFAKDAGILFSTSPELISGIQLIAGGHKLAWNIADYLGSLERATSAQSQKNNSKDVD